MRLLPCSALLLIAAGVPAWADDPAWLRAGPHTVVDGKIAGEEYLAYADGGEGKQNVAMLLQVLDGLSNSIEY